MISDVNDPEECIGRCSAIWATDAALTAVCRALRMPLRFGRWMVREGWWPAQKVRGRWYVNVLEVRHWAQNDTALWSVCQRGLLWVVWQRVQRALLEGFQAETQQWGLLQSPRRIELGYRIQEAA